MTQLVFIENDRVVTDSLTVAESFDKRHADVKRDIRNLESSDEFNASNFAHIEYKDGRNRTQENTSSLRTGFPS